MVTLAVDTSGEQGSLAIGIFENGRITRRETVSWQEKAIHSEVVTPNLLQLLSQSKTDLKKITHLAVNMGPGSFTGIRVGLNLVRTLAYSLGLPVASVDTLSLLAFVHGQGESDLFVAIRAIRQFYYCAGFTSAKEGMVVKLQPCSLSEKEMREAARAYKRDLIEGESLPSARTSADQILDWLEVRPQSVTFSSWKEVKPLYIRRSEAEEKLMRKHSGSI